jgi:pantothenate kinase
VLKTLKGTLKTLICTLGGNFKFYTLLDQSVYIKVVEHKKPSNFYIGEFSSSVEQFGLNCKIPKNTHVLNSEISVRLS